MGSAASGTIAAKQEVEPPHPPVNRALYSSNRLLASIVLFKGEERPFPRFSGVWAQLVWTATRTRVSEEIIERVSNVAIAFKICEVSTVFERDQLSVRNCPRDVRSDLPGEEIVIAA